MADRSNEEDLVAQLERIAKLHADGVLSDTEFAALKAKLVGGANDAPPPRGDGEAGPQIALKNPPSSEAASSVQPPYVHPITIGLVVGFIWSILAGVSAIVLLAEGEIGAAVFMLGSAVVAAPIVSAYAAAQWGYSISGGLRIVIAIAALGAAGYLLKSQTGSNSPPGAQSSDSSTPSDQNTSANSADLSMPADEAKFVAAVTSARDAYHAAANEMAQGGTRAARKAAICQALANGSAVSGWIGTIKALSSNTEGKGVLEISLAPGVSVTTNNNAYSDIGEGTLLESNSPVFAAASAMKEGDAVRFSGAFIADDVDCTREQSLTLQGSMEEPAFTFRFASVASPASSHSADSDSAQSAPQETAPPNGEQAAQGTGNEAGQNAAGDNTQTASQAAAPAVPAIGNDAMMPRFGNTLISRTGSVEWHMHFKDDGTFDGREMRSNYSVAGTWTIAGDQLCIKFEPPMPGAPASECKPLAVHQIGETWTSDGKQITLVQGIQ